MKSKITGLVLTAVLTFIYIPLSEYILISQDDVIRHLSWIFILIPTPGVLAFVYGFLSKEREMAFIVGFVPAFMFVITGLMISNVLDAMAVIHIIDSLYMGVTSGLVGVGGAMKKAKDENWIAFTLAGFAMWLFRILMGMG